MIKQDLSLDMHIALLQLRKAISGGLTIETPDEHRLVVALFLRKLGLKLL